MIHAVFKQQMIDRGSNRSVLCQVIVCYENKQYHAIILCLDGEADRTHYTQLDTPCFRSQYELKAHIKNVMGTSA